MSILSIKNLTVKYDNKIAVHNATLDIYSDDFIGIIGPNGGGKTSLVKAILGLVDYEGCIDMSDTLANSKSAIGYLPQHGNFDSSFPISVQEVILSGLQADNKLSYHFTRSQIDKANGLMSLTGITHLSNQAIGELSGGELQRTLLCRALISDPKLLILDEPANFVDSTFEKELYDILRTLNEKMAILMVSHDLGTITSFVKSIVCVNRTVHRHDTNELTAEMLENYNCPIQVVSHGEVPHTILDKH